MRFLVFMIPKVYQPKNGQNTDPNCTPDAEMMAQMGKFNDELKQAGALLAVDGLQPLTTGARLAFSGDKASVTEGASVKAKEVVGGYGCCKPSRSSRSSIGCSGAPRKTAK